MGRRSVVLWDLDLNDLDGLVKEANRYKIPTQGQDWEYTYWMGLGLGLGQHKSGQGSERARRYGAIFSFYSFCHRRIKVEVCEDLDNLVPYHYTLFFNDDGVNTCTLHHLRHAGGLVGWLDGWLDGGRISERGRNN